MRNYWITVGIVTLLCVTGCGGPAYEYDAVVTGTVTVDGDLAKSGTVTFHSIDKGRPAIGRIHPDGSYSLRTGQGDLKQVDGGTVMSGDYLVTVSINAPPAAGSEAGEGAPPIPGPSLIASKYAQKGTTDLRFTVKPGKQVIVLNLDGGEPAEPAEETGEAAVEEATDTDAAAASASPPAEGTGPADEAPEAIAPAEEPAAPEEKKENLESQGP